MADFDGNDVNSWRTVLHKAAAALKTNPGDTEAQEWRDRALQNIQDLEGIANDKDTREASDLGKGTAFALGAARGMSFGLGDLAQRLTDTPSQQQAVETTERVHPGYTLAGTLTGGAVPFLLAPAASGGALGGLSKTAVTTGLGAAQGFGLTPGDLGDRTKGAVMGAAMARFAPAAAKLAGKGLSGVSGLAGRIIGAIPKSAAPAAEAAASAVDEVLPGGVRESAARASLAKQGFDPDAIDRVIAKMKSGQQPVAGSAATGTAEEPAVLPKDYAQGWLGPMTKPPPDPLDVPTYLRRGVPTFTPAPEEAAPISEGPPGSNNPVDDFPRGPGGSVRWSSTQLPDPGMNLHSPAATQQLQMLKRLTPAQLKEALKNPLFASLAKALGVQ